MEIKNLQSIPVAVLAQAFNAAFSDYLIPIQLSESDLAAKMALENIMPEYSSGVFSGEKLVAFILVGIDNDVAYNGGTGVIPEFRGQNLTQKMYDFLFPLLAKNNIRKHQLEVITGNTKAIAAYEKIGFGKQRTVSCFKGNITIPAREIGVEIKTADFPQESAIRAFQDFEPTCQNSWHAMMRTKQMHRFLGASLNGKLVGYVVFAENGRIWQFAVAKGVRRKSIGLQLFHEVQKAVGNKMISITNVDDANHASIRFLQKTGLELTVQQFEMAYHFMG